MDDEKIKKVTIFKETSVARLIIRYFLFGAVVFAILVPPGTALIVSIFLVFKFPLLTIFITALAILILFKTKNMAYMILVKEEFIATKIVVLAYMKKIFYIIKRNLKG